MRRGTNDSASNRGGERRKCAREKGGVTALIRMGRLVSQRIYPTMKVEKIGIEGNRKVTETEKNCIEADGRSYQHHHYRRHHYHSITAYQPL